ncbi:hypothetical protein BJV77DRAFT_108698 [Russula vinacea]|nr:hypothetical protein BJV77DRAFT_108698 [Russula vinacea]
MKFSLALAAALFLPVLSTLNTVIPHQVTPPLPLHHRRGRHQRQRPLLPSRQQLDTHQCSSWRGGLVYSPSNFTASNGTTVTFFFPSYDSYHCCPFVMLMHAICRGSIAHSVTEGSFANPCVYLAAAGGNPAGFDSGLQTAKEFTIQITNDQEPVWFFCKNTGHCGLGMVGAINAPTTGNTYAAFLAAAKALGASEIPLSDTGPVTGGVGAQATATPGPTTATPSSSSTSSTSSSPASRLVANGLVALLAAAFGITLA